MLKFCGFYVLAGGFRTFYGFLGFRYLAEVAFEWISWTCGFRFLVSGFRRFCGFRGFRFLGRPINLRDLNRITLTLTNTVTVIFLRACL